MRLLPRSLALAALLGASVAVAPAAVATTSHGSPAQSRYGSLAEARAALPITVGHPANARPQRIAAVDRSGRSAAAGAALSQFGDRQQQLRAAAQPRVVSGTALSTWSVTFETPATSDNECDTVTSAQADSFNRAVDTWAHLVASSVPISVDACFHPLSPGQLGGAGPYDFQQFGGVYFPNALANSLTGRNGNAILPGTSTRAPDIIAEFSNDPGLYYYGADPAGIGAACPHPNECYDFQSVVLHELGHGLGFIGSVDKISAGHAAYGYDPLDGDEAPFVYDLFTETSGGSAVIDYPNESNLLYTVVTSNQVYWNGPEAASADRGREPRLFAPSDGFLVGSSYSHLDFRSYPTGDADSLMTPYADANDVTRDPGEITLGMFRDMGWVTPALPGTGYTPLPNPVQVLDWSAKNGNVKEVSIAGANGVPANATAVVLNLTAAATTSGNTQLFAYAKPRYGPLPAPPRVPNLVSAGGYTKDGLATVPLGTGSAWFKTVGGAAHNYASVVGYFTPSGGTPYAAATARRVVDTRTGTGTAKARIGSTARTIALPAGIPTTAVAVALNVSGINPSNTSTVQVFSSDLATPATGNVHTKPGQSATNLVIVKLGADHSFKVRTTLGSTDVVADLAGFYDASATGLFRPVLPQRIWGPTKLGATVKDYKVVGTGEGLGVPVGATSLVLDTVASFPSATTFLSTYATGTFPGITTLTVFKGKSASGASMTKPSAGGNVRVKNAAGTSTVSLDLFGYYAP